MSLFQTVPRENNRQVLSELSLNLTEEEVVCISSDFYSRGHFLIGSYLLYSQMTPRTMSEETTTSPRPTEVSEVGTKSFFCWCNGPVPYAILFTSLLHLLGESHSFLHYIKNLISQDLK